MANPTTNYAFAMPTNTDLVKDLPADFEIFGQAVDTQMKTNADLVIPKTIVDAKGDLIVASGSDAVARLAVGTNNYVLTADSTATNGIKWAALPSPGKVLQVVSASTNNAATTSGSSFVDASVSLSITPTANTSKILIICAIAGSTNAQNSAGYFTIYRGATNLGNATNGLMTIYHNASYSGQFRVGVPMTYLDSPATTSATTYAVYFKTNGVGTVAINNDTTNSTITLLEIGA